MNNENKRLKRKVRNSYAVSTVSMALVLLLAGAAGFMITATMKAAAALQNSVTLIVELSNDMPQEQRDALLKKTEENPAVTQVVFSSKEEKLGDEEFRRLFSAEFDEVLGENPLLDSYEVTVAVTDGGGEIETLKEYFQGVDGEEHVSYPAALIESMQTMVTRMRPLLLILAAVLAVISLTLLNSTIRLAIYSKRYIINTMKLVGATKWFIMRPFVRSSIGQGLAAGVLAAATLGAAVYAADRSLHELLSREMMVAAAAILAAMIAAGILLSLVFTLLAVNKFVNMKSNKIHLY